MLELKNLTKTFSSQKTLLDKISITFNKSSIHGIYGENGAGKSTLLKLISKIFIPDSGKIYFNNIDINLVDKYLSRLSLINSETRTLYERLTGKQNISFLSKIYKDDLEYKTISTSHNLNLENHLKKPISTYSMGMKQKMSIAVKLAKNADIILLDEFTDHLDDKSIGFLKDYLQEIKENKTIIYVSRSKENIRSFSDKSYYLSNGKIYE
jgi:ABC-type multidrug transport system ATPase subunit